MMRLTGLFATGLRRGVVIAAGLAVAALAGACRESIDGGASCATAPSLCPGEAVQIRDTIIDPVLAFDSTYVGFPTLGADVYIPLISYGNDLETVGVLRFDTLTTIFIPPKDTVQAITYVDSVFVRLRVNLTRAQVPDSVRIDLYDVNDATAADTASAPIIARLVPKYRIGGKTFAKASLVDSIFVPVDDSAMLAALADSSTGWPRLRVGVRATGIGGPVSFRIGTVESGIPATLFYRPKADTAVHQIDVAEASAGPLDRIDLRLDLLDYTLVSRNTLPDPPDEILLGGVPGRRAYLRFNIPKRLTDSSTILRATLRLNQVPYPFGGQFDTVTVHPHIVLAGPLLNDNRRASTLIGDEGLVLSDSLSVLPGSSGIREIEMYTLVRAWGAQSSGLDAPPRAIVLTVSNEGTLPRIAAFLTSKAAPGLRPSMRITYIPRIGFGVP